MSQTITVEFDPDQPMPGRFAGSDEEGPVYEPMSLLDAVVERGAEMITAKLDKAASEKMMAALDERLAVLIDERLPAMVEEALNGEVVVTSPFGSETWRGSLRERLVSHAREQLAAKEGRYGNEGSVLSQVIKQEIDRVLKNDLANAVRDAKSELLDRLRTTAAEVLANSVGEALRARISI